jgi:hypothetical protein
LEIADALTVITAIASIITAITLIFTYRQNKLRNMPHFELTALMLGKKPDRKLRVIHIQNPDKPINHCQVFCNGTALEAQFGLHFRDWIYIHAGGSADFKLPEKLEDRENATIVVKDGKEVLQKMKLNEIPMHSDFACTQ